MHRRPPGDGEKDGGEEQCSYEVLMQLNCPNPTIITQQMNGEIARWLLFTKLQKFQWFFNGLSYNEIVRLNEDNIDKYIEKVNKRPIKRSDCKKICCITRNLRSRPYKLKCMLANLDTGESTVTHLSELMAIMRSVLECPIPNKYCVRGVQLQQDIVNVMRKLLYRILREFDMINFLIASSFLGSSIKLYMECSVLVIHNQLYMKHHVEDTKMFVRILKERVKRTERDFY